MATRTFKSLAESGEIDNIYIGSTDAGKRVALYEEIEALEQNTQVETIPTTNLAIGWYTIAVNSGTRATGKFGIRDSASNRHAHVTFYASAYFGSTTSIDVLSYNRWNQQVFGSLRIKTGGTYDGAVLQVYINNATNTVRGYTLGDNYQTTGWVTKNWIPDINDPGDVNNYSALTEIKKLSISLNSSISGGILTTGGLIGGTLEVGHKLDALTANSSVIRGCSNFDRNAISIINFNNYNYTTQIDTELASISANVDITNDAGSLDLSIRNRETNTLFPAISLNNDQTNSLYGNTTIETVNVSGYNNALNIVGTNSVGGATYETDISTLNLSVYDKSRAVTKPAASFSAHLSEEFDDAWASINVRPMFENSVTEAVLFKGQHTIFRGSMQVNATSPEGIMISGGAYSGAGLSFYPDANADPDIIGLLGATVGIQHGSSNFSFAAYRSNTGFAFYPNGTGTVTIDNKEVVIQDSNEGWTIVTAYLNSWSNYSTTYQTRYKKNQIGTVFLEGLIKSGTISTGTSGYVFRLPVGYRPTKALILNSIASNLTLVELRITTTGYVHMYKTANNSNAQTWTSLTNISFQGE